MRISSSFELSSGENLQPLLEAIGESSIVMLGEASHGTHEYYTWRTEISRRLINEKKFSFIAVEGDWPDCYLLNRYVKGYPDVGKNSKEILMKFDRWPTWMWANWEIIAFTEWLKDYNSALPMEERVGFYGLDVYSLWDSMHAIIPYLEKADPDAVDSVKEALRCFEPYREEGQLYARAVSRLSDSCEEEVLSLLHEVRQKAELYGSDREAAFSAEQNARIAVNAEKYYRSMIGFDDDSWNIRDTHMMETLDNLLGFYNGKGIVWAHNTHIGDARATDMANSGLINIGQLAREQYGKENVFLVGFGSFEGSVIAGTAWGAPVKVMEVPPARKGSVEEFIHSQYPYDTLFLMENASHVFGSKLPHRAIGVVYHPEREKYSNYVPTVMTARYDAFIFLDRTEALHPLHLKIQEHKIPETFPFGV